MEVDSQSLGHLSPCWRTWQWACRTWFVLFRNSQGVVERQHFYQPTQNGARTANVFARQSKTHILKSSGLGFHNVITHWGHPGKVMQKIEPKSKRGIKESWIEPNGHNRNWSRDRLIVTPLIHFGIGQINLLSNVGVDKTYFWAD